MLCGPFSTILRGQPTPTPLPTMSRSYDTRPEERSTPFFPTQKLANGYFANRYFEDRCKIPRRPPLRKRKGGKKLDPSDRNRRPANPNLLKNIHLSGKEKTQKDKQFAGLSRDWVGAKILFMCFFFRAIPYGGEKNTKTKSPPKSRDNPVLGSL